MLRLDKYLSELGVGTRSELKKIIKSGRITVDGQVCKSPEAKIDEAKAVVLVDGRQISYEKFVYYLLNKPAGCVTATTDNVHKTVMEYLKDVDRPGLSPVGRLDLDTEGLLLITNDGDLNHRLMSPKHHVPKTYFAILDNPVPEEAIEQFREGVDIGDEKLTLPAKLILDETDKTKATLTITEGRYHQVKRMFETVGCTVTYLKRVSMGKLTLGNLQPGEYRPLSSEDLDLLG